MMKGEKQYICIEKVKGNCSDAYCWHYEYHPQQFSIEPKSNIKKFCFENGYHKIYNKESMSINSNAGARECAYSLNPHCIEVGSLEYEMLKIIKEHGGKK